MRVKPRRENAEIHAMLRRLPLAAILTLCAMFAITATASAFSEPKSIRSKNGVLKTTFVAEEGPATINGKTIHGTMTINKQYPGPTLKLKPGDRLEIKYVSRLREATNLHFHGLHVSPSGRADNVLRRFRPGTTNMISLKIPHDHPNGLFWYHPHLHGQVNTQVLRGLAGMILIAGGSERVPKLARFKSRNLALNLVQYDSTGTEIVNPNNQNDATATTLVNGKLGQTIKMRPGQSEIWRVANMSNEAFYKINLEGHKIWIVGIDGNPTRVARRVSQFIIPPGSRYEFLVRTGAPGDYKLRQLIHTDGFNTFPQQDLVTLRVGGARAKSRPVPRKLKPFPDLSKSKVAIRRRWSIAFSPNNAPVFQGLINGKAFDPDRIDTVAKLGAVEEWTFFNQTTQDHPMHVHTNDFQVVAVNGKRRRPSVPIDNAILPREGSLTIRFKPLTYTGVAVFHCHILFHEDSGMMATIRFAKGAKASATVRPAGSLGAYESAAISAKVFDPATAPDDLNPSEHSHGAGAGSEHRFHLPSAKSGRSVPGGPNAVQAFDWLYCRLDESTS